MSIFDGKSVLVTGATGSFGKRLIKTLLAEHKPKRLIAFSRDELKQFEMQQHIHGPNLRYLLGDIRDKERLYRALDGVDIVVHAAALKQVPACEYNPMEAIKTNVLGAENLINVAIDMKVERVLALSTDKASNPINLYGATKLCADKLFVAANNLSGENGTRFSVVRYGNVVGSRGSIVPFFMQRKATGRIPITDPRMTRFWITLDHGVQFVIDGLERMWGGEIFIPKIPSMSVVDVAKVLAPDCAQDIIGIRPGEKLHEIMITCDDAINTVEFDDRYVIQPSADWWDKEAYFSATGAKAVADDFRYQSDLNDHWLRNDEFVDLLKTVDVEL